MTVDCKSKRRLLCPNTLCSASNSCPICASAHIKRLTKHAIVPKQMGCIRHPTLKGTHHAHHRRSETLGHLTRLPCRYLGARALGCVTATLIWAQLGHNAAMVPPPLELGLRSDLCSQCQAWPLRRLLAAAWLTLMPCR